MAYTLIPRGRVQRYETSAASPGGGKIQTRFHNASLSKESHSPPPPRVTDIVSRYIWHALFTINLFPSQQSDRMGELFLFYFLSVLSVGDALAAGAASSHAFPYEAQLLSLLMKTDGLRPGNSVFSTQLSYLKWSTALMDKNGLSSRKKKTTAPKNKRCTNGYFLPRSKTG